MSGILAGALVIGSLGKGCSMYTSYTKAKEELADRTKKQGEEQRAAKEVEEKTAAEAAKKAEAEKAKTELQKRVGNIGNADVDRSKNAIDDLIKDIKASPQAPAEKASTLADLCDNLTDYAAGVSDPALRARLAQQAREAGTEAQKGFNEAGKPLMAAAQSGDIARTHAVEGEWAKAGEQYREEERAQKGSGDATAAAEAGRTAAACEAVGTTKTAAAAAETAATTAETAAKTARTTADTAKQNASETDEAKAAEKAEKEAKKAEEKAQQTQQAQEAKRLRAEAQEQREKANNLTGREKVAAEQKAARLERQAAELERQASQTPEAKEAAEAREQADTARQKADSTQQAKDAKKTEQEAQKAEQKAQEQRQKAEQAKKTAADAEQTAKKATGTTGGEEGGTGLEGGKPGEKSPAQKKADAKKLVAEAESIHPPWAADAKTRDAYRAELDKFNQALSMDPNCLDTPLKHFEYARAIQGWISLRTATGQPVPKAEKDRLVRTAQEHYETAKQGADTSLQDRIKHQQSYPPETW